MGDSAFPAGRACAARGGVYSPLVNSDVAPSGHAIGLIAVADLVVRGLSSEQLAACPTCAALCSRLSAPSETLAAVRPEDLGPAYEAGLARDERKARGAWFTPPQLVTRLVAEAVDIRGVRGLTSVLDPACGGGAFLLGAARALVARGVAAESVFAMLHGWDIDADVLMVARASLELLALDLGVDPALAGDATLVNADFLAADGDQLDLLAEPNAPKPEVDLVVGNPPFLTPLRAETARSASDRARLRAISGASAHRWVDSSVLFLQQAIRCVRPGGVCVLILPLSIVATRDAAQARVDVLARATMRGCWIDPTLEAFPGSAAVCAPLFAVVAPTDTTAEVIRWQGLAFEPLSPIALPPRAESWAPLAVDETSLPALASPLKAEQSLGDVAIVAADFRDQFYALAEVAEEFEEAAADSFPIVVTGAVDPARTLWGVHESRLNRIAWKRPVAKRNSLESHPVLAGWSEARLRPKILVASQTRIVEAVVDEAGEWLPCTPLISVVPLEVDVWELAAIIGSPVAARWARLQATGAARSAEAIKLSASQLRMLPIPDASPVLRAAGEAFRRAQQAEDDVVYLESLVESARLACEAYGLASDETDEMVAWWRGRLPRRVREVSQASG